MAKEISAFGDIEIQKKNELSNSCPFNKRRYLEIISI